MAVAFSAMPAFGAEDKGAEFFESKVLPVLQQRCFECHSHGTKIKGGLALDSRNGWQAMLWGRNLTNEAYLLSAFPTVAQSGSLSGYVSPPRMWGVTLRKTF